MAASPKRPTLPSTEAAATPQQLKRLADELWEEIFLRIASPSDLARASTACSSFRRLIADPSFLRRYRSIHPPLFLGLISKHFGFQPVEAPHPNAPAARALAGAAGFTMSYLPRGTWTPCDVLCDGRVLLGRYRVGKKRSCWFPDLTVCDPLSLRYLLLPPIPNDLLSSAGNKRRCIMPSFLPSGDEEEDASFRVISMMYCVEKLVVFIFSSGSGCWNIGKSTTWDALGLSVPPAGGTGNMPPAVSLRNDYAYGCFYWKVFHVNKLLKFDISNNLEFSIIDFPLDHSTKKTVIVEAAEPRLGMFSLTNNHGSLCYTTTQNGGLRSNEWKTEDLIPLPEGYGFIIVGALGGYIILLGCPKMRARPHPTYFSLEVKTLKIETMGRAAVDSLGCCVYPYIGFPPSMSPRRA